MKTRIDKWIVLVGAVVGAYMGLFLAADYPVSGVLPSTRAGYEDRASCDHPKYHGAVASEPYRPEKESTAKSGESPGRGWLLAAMQGLAGALLNVMARAFGGGAKSILKTCLIVVLMLAGLPGSEVVASVMG